MEIAQFLGGGFGENMLNALMIDLGSLMIEFPSLKGTPVFFPVRVVLLILLMVACHTIFLLEQPNGSDHVLPRHPRFEWLCNHVLYVFSCNTSYGFLMFFELTCGGGPVV